MIANLDKIEFNQFLDSMPSMLNFPHQANPLKQKFEKNRSDAAHDLLMHQIKIRELWGEMFDAMEKFDKLHPALNLFMHG